MDERGSARDQGRRDRDEAEREASGDPVARREASAGSGAKDRGLEAQRRVADQQRQYKSSEEIERDIARTRADMDETVSEIQRRLRPERLRRQAQSAVRETVRDTAQEARSRMFDTIRENPIPSILAGLSLGYLFTQGGSSSRMHREYREARRRRPYGRQQSYYYEDDYDDYGYDDDYYYDEPRYRSRGGGARYAEEYESDPYTYEERRYRTGDEPAYYGEYDDDDSRRSAGERAGEAADQARETAQQYGRQAQEQAQRYRRKARRQTRRAANQLEEAMDNNPLAVGAATLALGAFVGALLPSTRKENELMGPARDRVVRQARDAAEEKVDQAKRVAQKTADEAKDKAKDVADTAKQEAKKEDLDKKPKSATTLGSGSSSSGSSGSSSGRSSSGSSSSGSSSGSSSSGSSSSGSSKTSGSGSSNS